MVRVHLNGELFAEASHLLPNVWNGWVVPVFSEAQKDAVNAECVRLGWTEFGDDDRTLADEWESLGNGEWVTSGWVWECAQ
jgi:hypothetical protein